MPALRPHLSCALLRTVIFTPLQRTWPLLEAISNIITLTQLGDADGHEELARSLLIAVEGSKSVGAQVENNGHDDDITAKAADWIVTNTRDGPLGVGKFYA